MVSGFIIGLILRPKLGLISIDTVPKANVVIDGKDVGQTPLEKEIKAGDVLLKLVSTDAGEEVLPYETTITVTPGVKTIVRRTLGSSVEDSTGIIVSFEKTNIKEAGLAIISNPDSANILVDTNLYTTPLKLDSLPSGSHQVLINKFGYAELSLEIQAEIGHILTLRSDLARSEGAIDVLGMGPEPPVEPAIVIIKNTPTGFLRVRKDTDVGSEEVGRLVEGEKVSILEESKDKKWYKILLNGDKEGLPAEAGWISSLYASKSAEPVKEN